MTSSTAQTVSRKASSSSNEEFLLFTLGPVQRFIAAARKTSDLWAGSGLLSWLAKQSMQPLVNEYGTDALIFPYVERDALETEGRAVSYPNRFVALVPRDAGEALADAAQEAAENALQEVVDFGLDRFDIEPGSSPHVMAKNQAGTFLECYWSILPQNESLTYGEQYRLLEQQLGARKALRTFESLSEPGYRCDLIPSLGALVPDEDATPGAVRAFWTEKARHRPHRYLQEHEELSGVALAKRLFPDFKEKYANDSNIEAFPSTSSFAAADFKAAVLDACPHNPELKEAVLGYETDMGPLLRSSLGVLEEPISRLYEKARHVGVTNFPNIGGRWLFPEAFDRLEEDASMEERTISASELSSARQSVNALLRAARAADIPPPSRYYALVLLDGDNMGAWLSGEKNPEDAPVSRSYHQFVSRALGYFAQNEVPGIVEGEYLGKLVYSGGDDVMSLVSLRDALPMARSLRASFSGQRSPDNTVSWDKRPAFGLHKAAGPPTLGVTATASAGVVVAHHMQSLDQVLQAARSAESYAKDTLGRDALALSIMKRSGEHVTTGGAWVRDDLDLVGMLHTYMDHLQNDTISTGFLHTLAEAEPALRFVEQEMPQAIRAEVARVLERQSDLPDDTFLKDLGLLLDNGLPNQGPNQEPSAFKNVISLLSSAQFLVRGSLS